VSDWHYISNEVQNVTAKALIVDTTKYNILD